MCWYYSSSPPHSSSFLIIPPHSSSFLINSSSNLLIPPHSSSFLFTFSLAFANVTFYKKVTKVCQTSWQNLWQSSYHKSVTPGVLQVPIMRATQRTERERLFRFHGSKFFRRFSQTCRCYHTTGEDGCTACLLTTNYYQNMLSRPVFNAESNNVIRNLIFKAFTDVLSVT